MVEPAYNSEVGLYSVCHSETGLKSSTGILASLYKLMVISVAVKWDVINNDFKCQTAGGTELLKDNLCKCYYLFPSNFIFMQK